LDDPAHVNTILAAMEQPYDGGQHYITLP
jgi:hypothetical protein